MLKYMAKFTLLLLLAAFVAACSQDNKESAADGGLAGDYAINNVTVIDVKNGTEIPNQSVVVKDGKILFVGPVSELVLASGVAMIDGTNRYLTPGLMEMHTHVALEDTLVSYLATGVTTIRNMWGEAEGLEMRQKLADGSLIGPRLVIAGPLLDGAPRIWPASAEMTDPAEVEDFILKIKDDGYDFVKPYSRLTPEVFRAVMDAGQKHGVEISGHVPQSINMSEAVENGMRTSEHMLGFISAVGSDKVPYTPDLSAHDYKSAEMVLKIAKENLIAEDIIDEQRYKAFSELLNRSDHWIVPTIAVMKNFTSTPYEFDMGSAQFLSPAAQTLLKTFADSGFLPKDPDVLKGEDILYQVRADLLVRLVNDGAKILFGTDNSLAYGFGVIDELEELQRVGLTPAQILRSATYEGARYLNEVGQTGEVIVGAASDLVLLEKNPLEDVSAYRSIVGVMRGQNWYTAETLNVMLEAISTKNNALMARFDNVPQVSGPMVPIADFYKDEDQALRVASSMADGKTTINGAVQQDEAWHSFSVTLSDGNVNYQDSADQKLQIIGDGNGWRISGNDKALKADVAVVLTNTPADIATLYAAAGKLPAGEKRTVAVWSCDVAKSCENAKGRVMELTGLGKDIMSEHMNYEDSYAHRLLPVDGDGSQVDYWVADAAFFGGGPIRMVVDENLEWRRLR